MHISVVIPTYNRAHLIGRALRSVLQTLLPGDEVIVADDGSQDETANVVASFGNPFRYLRLPHGGAGRARNAGAAAAINPLIAFLDSDDEWMPDKLALQRAFLAARPDVLFCFSDFGLRSADGAVEERGLLRWHGDRRPWDQILGPGVPFSSVALLPEGRPDFRVHIGSLAPALMQWNFYVAMFTMVVRRAEAGNALHFAEDVATYEDFECAARLALKGPAAYFDCATAWQWGHDGPRLTDANRGECLTATLTILDRVFGRDAAFQAQHGTTYAHKMADQYVQRARWLLARGRLEEARADLRAAGGGPLPYRVLASFPQPVFEGLRNLYHGLCAHS